MSLPQAQARANHFRMNVPAEIWQFSASLVAILFVAWLVRFMGMGRPAVLESEDQARNAANEAVYGFDAIDCAIDKAGQAALLSDATGRILLLKSHGSKFAGRILGADSHVQSDRGMIVISSGEQRFGDVALTLDDGEEWARKIAMIGNAKHA